MESIQEALNADHNIQIPVDVMIDKIIEELVANPEYTRYYKAPYSQEDLSAFITQTVSTTEHGERLATMFIPPLASAMNIRIKYFQNYKGYYCQNIIKPFGTEDDDDDMKTIFLLFTAGKFQPLVCEGGVEDTMATPGDEAVCISTPPGSPLGQDTTCYTPDGNIQSNESTCNVTEEYEDVIILDNTSGNSVSEFQVPTTPETIRRGKAFELSMFNNVTPQKVDYLPHNIDGLKVYCINIAEDEDHKKKYVDGRYFKLTNTTRKGFEGDRKIGKCLGNYICHNPECPFLKEAGHPNTHQFIGRKEKFCFSCECLSTRKMCGAVKCIEYNKASGLMTVYHYGKHICTAKPLKNVPGEDKEIQEALKEHGHMGPKEICKMKLTKEIRKQINEGTPNREKIKQVLNTFNDRRMISEAKKKMEQASKNEIHSLAAVAELKEFFDPFDKYYIYELNDGSMNDMPSYVFKSSREMAQLMLKMDQNNEDIHPLQDEAVYFDGMHRRCAGFKTLTLWVLQIAMRRLTRLVTMEVKRENTACCELFWKTLNKMLSEVKGQPGYKFNPKQFIVDEAGAVAAGIRNVFGEEGYRKTSSCQFHYKQCLRRALTNMPNELHDLVEEFRELALDVLKVTTMQQYNEKVRRLKILADALPSSVGNWFDWWLARRYNLFPVFRGFCISSLNQAEIGHATLKPLKPLFLVDAANEDVSTMMMQEQDMKQFLEGQQRSTGRAPSKAEQAKKEKRQQITRARDYIENARQGMTLSLTSPETTANAFIPNKNARHRVSRVNGVEGHEVAAPSSQPRHPSGRNPEEEEEEEEEENEPNVSRPVPKHRVRATNRPHLCLLSLCKQVKKCYGCKQDFSDKLKKSPNDLILRMSLKRDVLINGRYQPG